MRGLQSIIKIVAFAMILFSGTLPAHIAKKFASRANIEPPPSFVSLFSIHGVRPDMRYYSRSRCFHPDPGTKHISVPPRHMTSPYAPDFQHDITTLQIQEYNISYNRHTTALNTIHQRKVYMSEYILQSNAYWQRENHQSP